MILTEIAFTMIKRDTEGEEKERHTDHIYLTMREEVAESIKQGKSLT